MRKKGNFYIYPAYFEAGRSRNAGRRVSKKLALQSVDIKLITRAAQRLGLEYEINEEARYPSTWWTTPGVVLIKREPEQSKTEILKELAKVMNTLKKAGVK